MIFIALTQMGNTFERQTFLPLINSLASLLIQRQTVRSNNFRLILSNNLSQ